MDIPRKSSNPQRSFRSTLVFWWILLLVAQQAQRFYLLLATVPREAPTFDLLRQVFITGWRADLMIATVGILVAAVVAGLVAEVRAACSLWLGHPRAEQPASNAAFVGIAGVLLGLLLGLLAVDMGYYLYGQHHLDFVFWEYVGEITTEVGQGTKLQAMQQTDAELEEIGKWGLSVAGFLLVELVAILGWRWVFRRAVAPAITTWETVYPRTSAAVLGFALLTGVTGCHPQTLYTVRSVPIRSAAYYALAQNPVLFGWDSLHVALERPTRAVSPPAVEAMLLEQAIPLLQETVGGGAVFPSSTYPLVRAPSPAADIRPSRPVNVLLLFIEALDRRYMGQTVRGVRLTPFLDRFKTGSVYFPHFFSNGAQSSSGLFATFCSYYPRQGPAVIKTRASRDFLCLPSILNRAGYRTELLISHRGELELNGLQGFMLRNGMERLLDEEDWKRLDARQEFNPNDEVLLAFVHHRLQVLRSEGKPFLLTALTLGTHHPFTVPLTHPDVQALQAESDGYIPALRYLDLQLERFFTRAQDEGLLKDTIVLLLGDHGRHEPVGRNEAQELAGHFLAPLFLWVDNSLRETIQFRPHIVPNVASQVDVAPTILALTGQIPRLVPFLGRDLSCALAVDCHSDNFAFVTNVYDDLIGVVDRDGFWLYSLRKDVFYQLDLGVTRVALHQPTPALLADRRSRRLLALYTSTQKLLDQSRIWSWKEFAARL